MGGEAGLLLDDLESENIRNGNFTFDERLTGQECKGFMTQVGGVPLFCVRIRHLSAGMYTRNKAVSPRFVSGIGVVTSFRPRCKSNFDRCLV